MQVTAKTIPDKQTGLERQIQNKEKTSVAQMSGSPKQTATVNPTAHDNSGSPDNIDQHGLSPHNQSVEQIAPTITKQHSPPAKTRQTDFETPAIG